MQKVLSAVLFANFLFFAPVLAGQFQIDGKQYSLGDVINATSAEKKDNEIFYSNSLNNKEATLLFIPGGYWDRQDNTLKDYWPLNNTQFQVVVYERGGNTSYEIQETLIGGVSIRQLRTPIKTELPYDQWTVRMTLQILDWRKPGIPYAVFQAIMSALEQQRNRHCLVGVEIRGTLMVYIRDTEEVSTEKELRIMFHPIEAKTIDIK